MLISRGSKGPRQSFYMDAFDQFLQIDPNSLGRRDVLGEKGFDSQIPQLQWIYTTISEAIQIGRRIGDLPPGFWTQIQNHAQRFINIADQINRYRIDSDAQSQYGIRNGIIRQIDNYYNSFFSGDRIDLTQNNSERNNFLTLLNTLKTFEVDSLPSKVKSALETSVGELNALRRLRENAEVATQELTSKAFQPATLAIYAEYFNNEAKLHSRLGLAKIDHLKKDGKKRLPPMGGAERWLLAGLSTTLATLGLLIIDVFTLTKDDKFSAITVANGLIVAILFFLSRFFLNSFQSTSICLLLIGNELIVCRLFSQ